jgi:hypothetical protein
MALTSVTCLLGYIIATLSNHQSESVRTLTVKVDQRICETPDQWSPALDGKPIFLFFCIILLYKTESLNPSTKKNEVN